MSTIKGSFIDILQATDDLLIRAWIEEMKAGSVGQGLVITDIDWPARGRELLDLLRNLVTSGGMNLDADAAAPMRGFLERLSRDAAVKGMSSAGTATFIFSLKKPLFERLRANFRNEPVEMAAQTWAANELVDQLGLFTVTAYQRSREDIIRRQQDEMLELSTPVVKLWDGVLALPMIGTLDSTRTQLVMEALLQRIVETGSEIAIIDITGVPTVDTLVAQHLIKTVTAIRLMGADCIISGIRPQIAQTIVHLGIDLQGIVTKATLADALSLALKRSGYVVSKTKT